MSVDADALEKVGLVYLAQSLRDEASAVDYDEYIQSEEWFARAYAAKVRAGHRCQVCYSPDKIQAHHRTYDRLGNELPTDITVLCDKCHKLFHFRNYVPEWY